MAQTKAAAKAQPDKLIDQFKAARRAATPLLAIQTADQFATVARIVDNINGATPFVQWDVVRGFQGVNKLGKETLTAKINDPCAGYFATACQEAMKLEKAISAEDGTIAQKGTVLFVLNAQRHLEDPQQVQAVCNLRDEYKMTNRMLVLVGPQMSLPAELQTDVVTLDEPLPSQDQLEKIIKTLLTDNNVEAAPEVVCRAVDAVQGLPAFAAEQVTAMSMSTEGLDIDALWERKRRQIEQTPGLSVSREGIKFADIGGLDVVKSYMRDLVRGNSRPNVIVMLEEVEKLLAGSAGDTSGVSQDQMGALLCYMQDNRAMGVILVGHAGGGKSAIAKATGNEAGIPTVKLDLGAVKDSLVGGSENRIRAALKVITSVGNGSSLWIATSNGINSLPPELRRRFRSGGPFFFDLPSKEERERIWTLHRAKYGIKPSDALPNDEGWTGAEIEQCAELAWRLNKSLKYAAQFVVPISQSAPDRIEQLRTQADGKWLSASHPGVYRKNQDAQPMAVAGGRKLNLED